MSSPKFRDYSAATRDVWGRELLLAERPEILGAIPVNELRPALVQAFLDGLAHLPGKQNAALAALKAVEKWALVRDRIPYPITTGCELIGTSGGHHPWTDAQIRLAEQHARPMLSRVISLGANTGQRGSDLVRMTWADLEHFQGRPGINVKQQKTGLELWVPLTVELQATMATWERRPGPLIGVITSRASLSNMWAKERRNNPSLKPLEDADLHLHGLRATACMRLSRAGSTTREITCLVGMSESMVARYCRFSDQRENALAAVIRLDRTGTEQSRRKGPKTGS